MPLIKSGSKRALQKNIATEMHAHPSDPKRDLAIAYSVKRKNKKMKKASGGAVESGSRDMNYADGGKVGGAKTSTTGNKTKTGGSNPGGASTGGAGTVTITTRDLGSKGINVSNVGGKTDSKNHGGMDPSDDKDDMMKARGGKVRYAEGGSVKSQKRPMPDDRYNDSKMVGRNSGDKAPSHDSWTDNSTVDQAQAKSSRKVLPIKHPKMVPQNVYSTRLRSEEDDLQSSASPGRYDQQPPAHDNELDASKSGNDVPDMAKEHSNHSAPYIKAIEDQYAQDMASANMKRAQSYAQGGPVMEPKDHAMELMERSDEAHLMDSESPSEDEGDADAHSLNEEGPNRHGDEVPDMEDEHSSGRKPYAEGGMSLQFEDAEENEDHDMEMSPTSARSADDSEDQPEDEADMEHEDSIAAAIMSKKQRGAQKSGSPDDDRMTMMAKGGEILSHGSMDSDDSDQADLSRNADEDANEEDQASFNALRKENYSESAGLKQLDYSNDSDLGDSEEEDSHDKHDKIDRMRSRMNAKRQFKMR